MLPRPMTRFFFHDTAPSETYTLSLHDALPISLIAFLDSDDEWMSDKLALQRTLMTRRPDVLFSFSDFAVREDRSEEHTSELQSHHDLVCRLLLEKKK